MILMYVVYLCGSTDCFPRAAFVEEENATQFATIRATNPEGYVIKHEDITKVDWSGN